MGEHAEWSIGVQQVAWDAVRLAVLASGSGTILSSMIEQDLPIEVVVVDRQCRAEEVAGEAGVAVVRLTRASFGASFDRPSYTKSLVGVLKERGIGLVAMAGFGTVLSGELFEEYPGRVMNTHPALLPEFKGWHAVQAALDAGVEMTGCTVHIATTEVDDGPILAQEAVPVLEGDTVESLHERIKEVERRLYPATLKAVLEAGGDPGSLVGQPRSTKRPAPWESGGESELIR